MYNLTSDVAHPIYVTEF